MLQVEGSRWADGGGSLPARRIYEALGGPAPVHGDDRIGVTRLTVTTVGEPDVSRRLGMGGRLRGWGHQHTMGRLVTLTPTVVVFNPGDRDISRPLAEVSRIERVSRNVRKGALIGLVTGALLSFAIGCDTRGDDCSNRLALVPFTLPPFGGIGVGTGAGIGAMVNAAQRHRNLLFAR